ncbi:MAG: uL15m family ribosomal protein [archaeon]
MQHKKSKCTRKRGSETHGHGSGKKARGSGNRGGKGMAGSGKRSEAKLMKNTGGDRKYLGKRGFVLPYTKRVKTINVETIMTKLESYVASGKAKKEKDLYTINLSELGYNKLLSKGVARKKLNVSVEYATENAVEKIKQAGGTITVLAAEENKTE